MGFWANWKEKRKKEKKIEDNKPSKTSNSSKKKATNVSAAALEESESQKFNRPILDNIDNEIQKTHQQNDDLIEDPHLHSQGFISPKQGVHIFVDDVVDNNSNLDSTDSEKKKKQSKVKKKN